MAKVLKCADVTGSNCPEVVRGQSEGDIMEQVARHAKEQHGLETVPAELVSKAKAAIRDG